MTAISAILVSLCALLGACLYVMNRWRILGLCVFVPCLCMLVPLRRFAWARRAGERLCDWYAGVIEETPTTRDP